MIPWPAFLIAALILISLGFESSRRRRAEAECLAFGHLWAPASGADHPNVEFCCTRCGHEVRWR